MKNLYDYEKTQLATVDLTFGAFKNESFPGAKDGTDIVAEHIQDIAYPLFQVLQLAGIVPSGELEDGNTKTQFLQALTNVGLFKHSDKILYRTGVLVWSIVGNDLILYRSNKADNIGDLSDGTCWTKILTIDKNQKINFHVDTNISVKDGSMPVFCFNSGPVDNEGNAALCTFDNGVITQHAPCVCTSAEGETFTITEDIQLDVSELSDGEHNVFYNIETGGLEVYQNQIFWQKSLPQNAQLNDIHIDTSIRPYTCKKLTSSGWQICKIVQNAVIVSVGNS